MPASLDARSTPSITVEQLVLYLRLLNEDYRDVTLEIAIPGDPHRYVLTQVVARDGGRVVLRAQVAQD